MTKIFPAAVAAALVLLTPSLSPAQPLPGPRIAVHSAILLPENFTRSLPLPHTDALLPEPDFLDPIPEGSLSTRTTGEEHLRAFFDSHAGGPTTGAPPPPPLTFEALQLGNDPQVAAGQHYLVVAEAHTVVFYDKSGNVLAPKNTIQTTLSTADIFQRFLLPLNADQTPNLDNVNRYAGFPANPVLPCDLSSNAGPLAANSSCINEVFDLRVTYDSTRNRFLFAGTARNQIWVSTDPKCLQYPNCYLPTDPVSPLARRYTMFAMTITEDPRDGLFVYWLPAGGDWPQIAANNQHFLVGLSQPFTHYNADGTIAGYDPAMFVFASDDIAKGNSTVATWFYSAAQLGGVNGGIAPVVAHGATGGSEFFTAVTQGGLTIWAWIPSLLPNGQPQLLMRAQPLAADLMGIRGSPVYVGGKLHVTAGSYASCPPNQQNEAQCASKVRLVRVAITVIGNVALSSSLDLDYSFGHQGPGDDPSDIVSYELPSLEVTKNGDMVIGYIREPFKTKNTLYNETRYSIFYHNQSTTKPSVLVHQGEGAANQDPLGAHIDLAVQSLDPDGVSVWITHAYARADGGYNMVVTRVTP